MSERHPLYQAAIDADEAFSAAITAAHGKRASRWNLPMPMRPAVEQAYEAKKLADWNWMQHMQANRSRTTRCGTCGADSSLGIPHADGCDRLAEIVT